MSARRLQRRLALLLGALMTIAAIAAPAASADVGQTIIRRCAEGKPLGGFTQGDYRKALKEISATTEEYSECGALIRQAQLEAASGHGGASGAGGVATAPITATPAEQRSIAGAVSGGGAPVSLGGGALIHPGVVHGNVASAFSTLPAPLLAALAFMLACALAAGGNLLRRRFGGGRPN
jgi:hypothetical protein